MRAYLLLLGRAVGRSENPGVPVLFSGNKLPPLVEIGLTDLPKFGGAMVAPPAPPGTTGLDNKVTMPVYVMIRFLMQQTLSSNHFRGLTI